MKIVLKDTFLDRLENQIDFIAKDSPQQARRFKKGILSSIKSIPQFPFRCRKSIYFENENIRDLIYKGYTIVYRITKDSIEVFGLVKYKEAPL